MPKAVPVAQVCQIRALEVKVCIGDAGPVPVPLATASDVPGSGCARGHLPAGRESLSGYYCHWETALSYSLTKGTYTDMRELPPLRERLLDKINANLY